MGFFDFIKSAIGKVSDFVAPVISKISDGIGSAIDFGRKAVNFASNLPIIGDVVRNLQNTPVGMAIGTIANAIRPEQAGGSSSAGQPAIYPASSAGQPAGGTMVPSVVRNAPMMNTTTSARIPMNRRIPYARETNMWELD